MKISLNTQIFLGAVIGVLSGLGLASLGPEAAVRGPVIYLCGLIGSVFINLLKMILFPLVFISITAGIVNLRQHAQMGRVWRYTLIFFLSTPALAVLISLIVVNIFKPGKGLEIAMFQETMSQASIQHLTLSQFIQKFFSQLFVNPFAAMAEGQVLGVIVFAIFLGIALVARGDKAKVMVSLLNEFLEAVMIMVRWIMRVLPLGIMALLMKLVATQDPSLFKAVGKFMLVVLGVTIFHGAVVLPLILKIFSRMSLKVFFNGIREAMITALSTSSSSATMPVTYRCTTENLKVNKDVAGFVIPLGTTVNMDGTAIYESMAALFVANLVGVELSLGQQVIVFFMAILASIGAPGIPSAGMVTMVMVLQSVGLPAEAIAILIPIDRPLDAVRTMVNVEGDAIGSVIVDRWTRSQSLA